MSSFFIIVGTNVLSQGGTKYYPETIFVHEKFNELNYNNDIGLVKTSSIIKFSKTISSISLPTDNFINMENKLCQFTGWGALDYNDPPESPANKLQRIDLLIISKEECLSQWHFAINPSNHITANHLCTYTKVGEGICHVSFIS